MSMQARDGAGRKSLLAMVDNAMRGRPDTAAKPRGKKSAVAA